MQWTLLESYGYDMVLPPRRMPFAAHKGKCIHVTVVLHKFFHEVIAAASNVFILPPFPFHLPDVCPLQVIKANVYM